MNSVSEPSPEHFVQGTNSTSPPFPSHRPSESAPGRTAHGAEPKALPDSEPKLDPARLEKLSIHTELEDLLEERKTLRTEEEKEKAWADASGMVKTYSDEMVERWNKVIDTYLVFAGLFSAILTAFNVQSYQLLQPPSPDPVAVLQQISLQMHSFMINAPFINSTAPPAAGPSPPNAASGPAAVPRSAIWLNILWFSGLIISLTSALLGILVKQWLNEYVSLGLSGISREAARLRQYRLNNLVKWRIGDIVILIPVLLLISLGLFLAGLLVLLWTLHPTVAAVASVLVGVVGVFTVGVTFLPLFNNGCAYLTPQTFAFYSVWRHFYDSIVRPIGYHVLSAPAYKLYWRTSFRFPEPFHIVNQIVYGVSNLFPESSHSATFPWRIHERRTVDSLSHKLDLDILNTAYDCTLDIKAASAAAVCLLDEHSLPVLDYFVQLCKTAEQRSLRNVYMDELLLNQALLCALQMSTMQPFSWAWDCYRVWRCIPNFLPLAGHRTPGNAKSAEWLQKIASWLYHRVLNPDTSKIAAPDFHCGGWKLEDDQTLEKLRSYLLGLSMEGDMTTHKSKITWSDTVSIPLRHDFNSSYRDILRWFQLATYTRAPRDYNLLDWDARAQESPQIQIRAQLHYLRYVREFLPHASRLLSSSDWSGPHDHHIIRTQTVAILSGFSDLLRFLCRKSRAGLCHFSHEHLDALSDVVNGLVRGQINLFPLIRFNPEFPGESLNGYFWTIYRDIGAQRQDDTRVPGSHGQAHITQSLDNFRSAQNSYRLQYQAWQNARCFSQCSLAPPKPEQQPSQPTTTSTV